MALFSALSSAVADVPSFPIFFCLGILLSSLCTKRGRVAKLAGLLHYPAIHSACRFRILVIRKILQQGKRRKRWGYWWAGDTAEWFMASSERDILLVNFVEERRYKPQLAASLADRRRDGAIRTALDVISWCLDDDWWKVRFVVNRWSGWRTSLCDVVAYAVEILCWLTQCWSSLAELHWCRRSVYITVIFVSGL